MTPTAPGSLPDSHEGSTDFDRRAVLLGLAGLIACPNQAFAALDRSWTLATQIVAGTRVVDPTVLKLAVEAIGAEFGAAGVEKLRDAVLARDAANIVDPFPDPTVEAAARRFVEVVYTGEITVGSTLGFHQALAWQVLPFAKPPSVCGPGFGWWTKPPDDR
jgi:hypothetical protein